MGENENDISVEISSVEQLAATVYEKYADVEQRLNNIASKKDELSSYWESDGATQFGSDLEDLKTKFDTFGKRHADFLESMKNLSNTYKQEQEALTAAVNARTGGGPGNFHGGATGPNAMITMDR